MSRFDRSLLVAGVPLVLLLITVGPASAHAEFESGSPGPGDEVVGSPSVLVVEFSQDLDPSRSSLVVRDAAGDRVARGGELGDTPRQLSLALPELAPGVYEVRWTSYSAEDGELDRGSYTFTVLAPSSPTPPPAVTAAPATPTAIPSASPRASPTPVPPTPSPTPDPGTDPASIDGAVIVPIVVALLVVAALGAWLLRRQRA